MYIYIYIYIFLRAWELKLVLTNRIYFLSVFVLTSIPSILYIYYAIIPTPNCVTLIDRFTSYFIVLHILYEDDKLYNYVNISFGLRTVDMTRKYRNSKSR